MLFDLNLPEAILLLDARITRIKRGQGSETEEPEKPKSGGNGKLGTVDDAMMFFRGEGWGIKR